MSDDPKIPFAAKRVWGQPQKGDAIWNGERWVKVKKVPTQVTVTRMMYPIVQQAATFAIRKCEVEQLPLPNTEEAVCLDE